MKLDTIVCGDCLDVMEQMPDGCVDLVVADPPYGINYQEWDKFDDFWLFTETWVKECFRVLKNNGSFYSFMGWSHVAEFKVLLDKYGKIRNWITWWRTKGRGSSTNFKSMKEELLYYVKSETFTWNEIQMLKKHVFPYVKNGKPRGWFTNEDGVKCRWTGLGNVWCYTNPFWKMSEWAKHPAQKPELMLERIVLASSNKDNLIFDPFMGSGTTAVAALKLGRRFYGCDINPEYVEIANQRIEKTRLEMAQMEMDLTK